MEAVQATIRLEHGDAWFYHARDLGSRHLQIRAPENKDVRVPPGYQWCVTHRPYTDCQCGAFTLEWA